MVVLHVCSSVQVVGCISSDKYMSFYLCKYMRGSSTQQFMYQYLHIAAIAINQIHLDTSAVVSLGQLITLGVFILDNLLSLVEP